MERDYVEFDPDLYALRPAAKSEPRLLGNHPPQIDPKMLPTFSGGPPPPAPGMVTPSKPKAKRGGVNKSLTRSAQHVASRSATSILAQAVCEGIMTRVGADQVRIALALNDNGLSVTRAAQRQRHR